MNMPVADAWTRIEAWLAEHARFVLETLSPGAGQEAIRETEATLAIGPLPDDFVQSWQIHDGQTWRNRPPLVAGAHGSYSLLPLRRVVEHWEAWTELLSSGAFAGVRGTPRGPVRAKWWNRRWIPIGVNGVGDLICLDLDPPKKGTVGQVIEVLHEEGDRTVLAASLGGWLDRFATDLEAEMYEAHDVGHDRYFGLVHARDL